MNKVMHGLLTLLLVLTLLPSFSHQANAYGLAHHEKVVDAGQEHFVVLKEDGSVWVWGNNQQGQLGAGVALGTTGNPPLAVIKADGSRLSAVKAVSAGAFHTLALDTSGRVFAWGANTRGQTGQAPVPTQASPQQVVFEGDIKIKAIAAGDFFSLAVDVNGDVWAWGDNDSGQLGADPAAVQWQAVPRKISGLSSALAITAGASHALMLHENGTVYGWGKNNNGQLGNGQTQHASLAPTQVTGLTNVTAIAAGNNFSVALKQDTSAVYAWGANHYGQLGDGGRENKLTPVQVQSMTSVTAISAGDFHTAVLKADGTVWVWGRNTSGTQTSRSTPIQVQGVTNAQAIGSGGYVNTHTLIVTRDGYVWKWDEQASNATTKLPEFAKVSGIDGVMQVVQFPFVQGGQVLFRYVDPAATAKSVKVNGNFNNWVELPMTQVSAGVWELQAPLQPGEYNYGFLVDGNWTVDPLNRDRTVDEFGNPLSVVNVVPYATAGPLINGKNVTFTYSSFDYNGLLELDANTTSVSLLRVTDGALQEVPMQKQSNNTWAVTQTVEPGKYYYSFLVRDAVTGTVAEKRNDPLNPSIETHSVTGISRNTFTVTELLPTIVPVTGIELNRGPSLDLIVGEQEFLRATVTPSNASNKAVNWSSSNQGIVSIDTEGKLTAHSTGTAVVVGTTVDGGKTAFVTVTVNARDGAVSYPRAGYKEWGSAKGVAQNKKWTIFFNDAIDASTVNQNNVYVLNDSGIKVPVALVVQKGNQALDIRVADGFLYTPGATYYLFIEKTVRTQTGAQLKEPIQMKFTIGL